MTQNQHKDSKIIKIDAKNLPQRPKSHPESASDHVPFVERVELMMQDCGLSREEAEAESLKWEADKSHQRDLNHPIH
jgi:hypothetical protein